MEKIDSILFVEDDEIAQKIFANFLSIFTKKLSVASNGLDGLELYKKNQYDIVISDINIPLLNGLEMVEEIKKINENQSVFLISGYSDSDYLFKAIELHVDGFFTKPVNLEDVKKQLLKTISNILNKKELQKKEELYQVEVQKNLVLSFNFEKQQEELINQSRFAAMGEMISMIAHQWRQPLNNIMLNATTIENMVENKKIVRTEFNKTIYNIYNTVDYMNKTIEDFRNFVKKDDQKREFKVVDLVLKPKTFIESELRQHNINFELKLDIDESETINISSSKFIQVVMNIYKNAIDAIVQKKIEKPFIKVNISKKENNYIFMIYDNAGGIPANIINRVFEPYFSTKAKNGTGIGLYMCKKIMNEYFNGNITVDNNDFGASFKIYLDMKEGENKFNLPNQNYNCYNWSKEKNSFIRIKNSNHKDVILENETIVKMLNSFYIQYEIDDELNIKLI